jgi:hypothetical protein
VSAGPPEGGEVEALIVDRYLEQLLSATSLSESNGPESTGDPAVSPEIRLATGRLRDDLPRLHPSFRFEERLAQRLADVAVGLRLPSAVGGEATIIPIALVRRPPSREETDDDLALLFAGPLDERPDFVRPLLIGGALTSAALSLAGAAYVAWRRTRPASTPMERAVRAVASRRLS